ncbi:TIM barrel protein [Paracoccus bogoriensis]|uniref:hydroxypyruvate isomerase family protein n=1 Tax=Paracoccus bogoriensis TaxID=242065 RepID=UPI001CA49DBF|nr:TIM barrel protein [Paracoccus bogoriensis]MBW7056467.1 TIM barrel protein [Paracoccus bogoriensis]
MPRFAANLSVLFTELPMPERFAAAAEAGFEGVEILFPYDLTARELSRAAIAAGTEIVLINAPPPNWTGGPRGFAAVPGLEERFRRDFERSLRVAEALRVRHINIMAGRAAGPQALDTLTRNLAWAAERAPHASLTIEPACPQSMPGVFLTDYGTALDVIRRIGAPNLGLQLDMHHALSITGDLVACWRQVSALTRHVQIGGWPARNEPEPETEPLAGFMAALRSSEYRGWIGAEYEPARTTQAGLNWLGRLRGLGA